MQWCLWPQKSGQENMVDRVVNAGLQKKMNGRDAGGVVSTSRADATSMQLPCRGKLLYVCTATAGEDCQDTELSLDEKPSLRFNLFQYVKVHKSQYLSDTQNAQIIVELSGLRMRLVGKWVRRSLVGMFGSSGFGLSPRGLCDMIDNADLIDGHNRGAM